MRNKSDHDHFIAQDFLKRYDQDDHDDGDAVGVDKEDDDDVLADDNDDEDG